jgi:hypothetical protein
MKTAIAVWVALWVLLAAAPTAFAEDKFYLPTVAAGDQAQAAAQFDFVLADRRLWDIYETGGAPGDVLTCGRDGQVHVHVFRVGGDTGPGARLDGVVLRVAQYVDGRYEEQFLVTGAAGEEPGQVSFALRGWAEVRLLSADGIPESASPAAYVSSEPGYLSYAELQQSLYCRDDAECTDLVRTNTCAGKLSWNVVFVRSF